MPLAQAAGALYKADPGAPGKGGSTCFLSLPELTMPPQAGEGWYHL